MYVSRKGDKGKNGIGLKIFQRNNFMWPDGHPRRAIVSCLIHRDTDGNDHKLLIEMLLTEYGQRVISYSSLPLPPRPPATSRVTECQGRLSGRVAGWRFPEF